MLNLRENTEEREYKFFSKYAQFSRETTGRLFDEPKCDIRTEYQRDRDRIIHSKSFRRLKHKTQVFLSPEGDHYRTRLTHTLEVAQIARTIARGLMLNEDLTEAISLGHDLGHTPFGHAGERCLDRICPMGFRHNEQSLRVVNVVERQGGLNLTAEVRDGILCHTGKQQASTLEGRIVALADRIAYINHDIDDAVRAGVLDEKKIPTEYTNVLGKTHSARINTMIMSVLNESTNKNEIIMQPEIYTAMMGLRTFMYENVYVTPVAQQEEKKVFCIIEKLYNLFIEKPELMPKGLREISQSDDIHTVVKDYIASMTDQFAIAKFTENFVPKSWNK